MNKKPLLVVIFMLSLIISAGSVMAVSLLASIYMFESSGWYYMELNSTEDIDVDLIGFHQYSSTWYLFFRHDETDVAPYDNVSITVSCNDASPVTFYTTFYQEWVDDGELTFSYDYSDSSVAIPYNDHLLYADVSHCEVSADILNFNGNGAYNSIYLETIPLISVLENYDCSMVDSTIITTADSMTSFFTWLSDMWEISWYVYSIGLVIFAVFVIPVIVFVLLRYAIYKIFGFKIVEKRA